MPRRLRSDVYLFIIPALCKGYGEARFYEIVDYIQKEGGRFLAQHISAALRELRKRGIIEKVDKAKYRLVRVAPYCLMLDDFEKYSYVGALGLRDGRSESEPEIAIRLLIRSGIRPVTKIVLTTSEGKKSWEDRRHMFELAEIELIHDVSVDELKDIELMTKRLEAIIDELSKHTIPIIDCTSLNKIYTIAAHQVAIRNHLPLIYVYEETKELVWLRQIEELRKQIKKKLPEMLSGYK